MVLGKKSEKTHCFIPLKTHTHTHKITNTQQKKKTPKIKSQALISAQAITPQKTSSELDVRANFDS